MILESPLVVIIWLWLHLEHSSMHSNIIAHGLFRPHLTAAHSSFAVLVLVTCESVVPLFAARSHTLTKQQSALPLGLLYIRARYAATSSSSVSLHNSLCAPPLELCFSLSWAPHIRRLEAITVMENMAPGTAPRWG